MAETAVVFGGPSSEHDVSILTGLAAARTLAASGPVTAIYWTKNEQWYQVDAGLDAQDFADGVPRGAKELSLRLAPDGGLYAKKRQLPLGVVVNCCHGGPGEDGTLQAGFDLCGLRYTGPSAAGAALGMDKLAFGAVAAGAGLPSLPRVALSPAGPDPAQVPFEPPFLLKPRFGGSSLGLQVMADLPSAIALVKSSPHMRMGAVMEPYVEGSRDVNVAIRTYPEAQLSGIEAPARLGVGGPLYSYTDKYLQAGGLERAPRELPARLESDVEQAIRTAALRLVPLALVRSVARLDFLQRGDDLWVNEINTIPGSLASYLWIEPKLSFAELLRDLIEEASRHPSRVYITAGADGTLLRSAGSIASKLAADTH
jgi:D-alanine-D-alanine ligase